MKKIFIIILVLISVQSFGQMKLYARRCNTNGTTDSIDHKFFTDSLFLRSNGQFVAHTREYYTQISGLEFPIGFENYKQRADGIWENDNCTVNNTTVIPAVVQASLDNKLPTDGSGSQLTGLTKTQVGLSNVDNTSDLSKPVSTATQTALNGKENSLGFTPVPNTRTVNGKALNANISVTASDVGLGNVDNTSDATKNAAAANLTNKTIGGFNAALDAGANDSYVITLSPAPAAYTTGMIVIFRANTANTTGCTINVNGLGVKAINKRVNTATATGDILALMWCMLIYDGANFIILNPIVN